MYVCKKEHLSSTLLTDFNYIIVLSAKIIMFYIKSSDIINLIAESLYQPVPLSSTPSPLFCSVSMNLTFFFKILHISKVHYFFLLKLTYFS